MGDFEGATGDVWENLMVLMGRGPGDSAAAVLDELADAIDGGACCGACGRASHG